MPKKPYDRGAFREELKRRMPGLAWTVANAKPTARQDNDHFNAEGSQSSGSNRLITVAVMRSPAGRFTAAAWLGMPKGHHFVAETGGEKTLARALRELQEHCAHTGRQYAAVASYMQDARTPGLSAAKHDVTTLEYAKQFIKTMNVGDKVIVEGKIYSVLTGMEYREEGDVVVSLRPEAE